MLASAPTSESPHPWASAAARTAAKSAAGVAHTVAKAVKTGLSAEAGAAQTKAAVDRMAARAVLDRITGNSLYVGRARLIAPGLRPPPGATGRTLRACVRRRKGRTSLSCRRANGLDDLLGAIGQIVGGDDVEAALVEDLLAQFDVGAFQPHHQRNLQAHLPHRGHHALGDDVATHDAAEDVDQDPLHKIGR